MGGGVEGTAPRDELSHRGVPRRPRLIGSSDSPRSHEHEHLALPIVTSFLQANLQAEWWNQSLV